MEISIKNMVCQRCIWAVKDVLDQKNIEYKNVSLGLIEFNGELSALEIHELNSNLNELGFEVLIEKEQVMVNKIKSLLIQRLEKSSQDRNLSEVLSQELATSYEQLSRLFSQVNGTTIEKYYNALRIEKAKELLHYGQLDSAQIAYDLAYSSPAHFSSSFKTATGFTPSQFKKLKPKRDGLADV